jgi:hypothetical protein
MIRFLEGKGAVVAWERRWVRGNEAGTVPMGGRGVRPEAPHALRSQPVAEQRAG